MNIITMRGDDEDISDNNIDDDDNPNDEYNNDEDYKNNDNNVHCYVQANMDNFFVTEII